MMGDATIELRSCTSCGNVEYWDFLVCHECGAREWKTQLASGDATVYSFSEVHFAPTAPPDLETPFLLALVELEEGPRLMTHIEAASVHIGEEVTLRHRDIGGTPLPVFAPSQ